MRSQPLFQFRLFTALIVLTAICLLIGGHRLRSERIQRHEMEQLHELLVDNDLIDGAQTMASVAASDSAWDSELVELLKLRELVGLSRTDAMWRSTDEDFPFVITQTDVQTDSAVLRVSVFHVPQPAGRRLVSVLTDPYERLVSWSFIQPGALLSARSTAPNTVEMHFCEADTRVYSVAEGKLALVK